MIIPRRRLDTTPETGIDAAFSLPARLLTNESRLSREDALVAPVVATAERQKTRGRESASPRRFSMTIEDDFLRRAGAPRLPPPHAPAAVILPGQEAACGYQRENRRTLYTRPFAECSMGIFSMKLSWATSLLSQDLMRYLIHYAEIARRNDVI